MRYYDDMYTEIYDVSRCENCGTIYPDHVPAVCDKCGEFLR